MFRTRLARLAVVAGVCLTSGCGMFDRCCGTSTSSRPGLFSRFRGQSPTEYVVPSGGCDSCPNGALTSGPFLGNPPATAMPGNMMLPSPRPAIPQIQEGQAQPMPYDPNKPQSRPGVKPSGSELKTAREG